MSEFIFFILGCVVGSVLGVGVMAYYLSKVWPSQEELDEIKDDLLKVRADSAEQSKAPMH